MPRAPHPDAVLNWPHPTAKGSPPVSLAKLAQRALRLCVRRWPLYLAVCSVVAAAEYAAIALSHFSALISIVVSLLLPPVVAATVTVNVAADALGEESAIPRTGRILERLWAVIVIELIQWYVYANSTSVVYSASGLAYLGVLFLGVLGFMLLAGIIYADVDACLEQPVKTLTLVPFAFLRSLSLAFADPRRALVLLALQVVSDLLLRLALLGLLSMHIAHAEVWVIILGTLMVVPVWAFTTVVYLDLIWRQRETGR
ncbi:MAG: hypothetical protein ACXWNZ_01855 [Vulcanimicrobiaceae bacterium]